VNLVRFYFTKECLTGLYENKLELEKSKEKT